MLNARIENLFKEIAILKFLIFSTIMLLPLNSISINAQSIYCDTTNSNIFSYAEFLPTCNITAEDLELKLNQNIHLSDFNINNEQDFLLLIHLNCHGEGFFYKVMNIEDESFKRVFIDFIKNNVSWTPAYLTRGKQKQPVNFSFTLSFKIINGKLLYLDDKIRAYRNDYYFIEREKPLRKSRRK